MAASKRVGYAVVGLGHIAQRAILPAFRSSKKAKLVALVSGDEKKAKRLGAKFGAPGAYTYADYDRCLSRPEVDAFIVEAGTPGFKIAERIAVIAPHPLARLRFSQCRVPAAQRIGESGEGFKVAMRTLDVFRTSVAAASLGFARRALDEALHRATTRKMFNQTLADFIAPYHSGRPACHGPRRRRDSERQWTSVRGCGYRGATDDCHTCSRPNPGFRSSSGSRSPARCRRSIRSNGRRPSTPTRPFRNIANSMPQ